MRVRILRDHKQYKEGEVTEVTPNIAHGLIELGVAMISKDMTPKDYRTNRFRKVKRGRSTVIRPDHSK